MMGTFLHRLSIIQVDPLWADPKNLTILLYNGNEKIPRHKISALPLSSFWEGIINHETDKLQCHNRHHPNGHAEDG
jgi:hypothetical protein